MADPLGILRQFHITKKPILEKNDQIIFGDNLFPKTAKTNYVISGSGKNGLPKEYYTLETLLFFIKNIRLPHRVYLQNAATENIPAVKNADRKDLLLYLSGISASSPSIDKKARIKNSHKITGKEECKSVPHQNKTMCEQSKQLYEKSKSIGDQSKPLCEKSKSIGDQCKPLYEKSKSIGDQSKPLYEKSKSIGDQSKPLYEQTKSISEQSKSLCEQSKLVCEEDKSMCQDPVPVLENISDEDINLFKENLKNIPFISSPVIELMKNLAKKAQTEEFNTQKGLSFLDLKILIYSNYLANLSYYIFKKTNGESIENEPVIERLVELRVIMEKMKPIEEKLKYQINKLLSYTSSENIDTNDPLKFRANPDNLNAQEEEASDEEKKESKVYVPPKISAAYYEEENLLEQKKKALEKAKKKALSSTMLYELRKEYDTGPEEIKEMHDPYKRKIIEEIKERERFEEEYMMRLPMTKQQRHEMRQLTTVTNFNTKVDDISALEMTPESMQLKKKSNSKKGKFKYRGKKKGFKRKF